VARIQARIAAGDIYQANLTFPARVALSGHPVALFARLFRASPAPHAALVFTGAHWWLSLSPELFFTLGEGALCARPMKGTRPRGASPEEDADLARDLAADPKDRAENLMITDLIRHDLARVSSAGSVAVPSLFAIESYPYVHQMTSTVTARLAPGLDAFDALAALFPCGSVTGAPKIRAQEIIAEVEPHPRGLYCGAIGRIGPGAASARFSVAIRTLVLDEQDRTTATLGLGSGIVADSQAEAEWRECLTKARFLAARAPETLIETIRREPDGRIPLLARHLARLKASARRFDFAFPEDGIRRLLESLAPASGPERLRLLLARSGGLALQQGPAPAPPPAPAPVRLVPLPVAPDDWRLSHKTGDRAFYDSARRACGSFEVIFHRPDGSITEGSFTNVFLADDEGQLLTPRGPGLLPGVLRAELLATGRARATLLAIADVQHASERGRLFLGNALRGLFPARLA
ncbi:MAG: aminodeoxychorismate synthase component I, partial [Sphingomonadaceae bacterium]